MTADIASTPARDAKVVGLVSAGHFLSHFYILALPPLFPLLRHEYGITYVALGAAVTVYNLASGVVQVPIGFLVDRVNPRLVLAAGLTIESLAVCMIGASSSYWALVALLAVAGFGDSVFHPSDYAILNGNVGKSRLGRAFGVHTFAGNLGFAVAPATMLVLTSLWSWRAALVLAGVVGLGVALMMLLSGRLFDDQQRAVRDQVRAAPPRHGGGVRLLLSPPILLFFLFYVATSMGTGGIQTFSVAAIDALYDMPLASANVALTGFLFASAVGILLGGVLADRTQRYDLITVVGFVLASGAIAVVALMPLPVMLLTVALSVAGLLQGATRPSRDMMVRAVTPAGASGRVFGFVSSGLNVGGAISPLLFGWVIDRGNPGLVFWLVVGFLLAAAAIAVVARARSLR